MAKIAVSIPDSALKTLEESSHTAGMNRSQYVAMAIEFYSKGSINIDKLNNQLRELESLSSEVLPLREKLHTLENTLMDKDHEIGTKANEVFQKDKRIHTLENQIAEAQKKIDSLSYEVLLQKDEGMKFREELEKRDQRPRSMKWLSKVKQQIWNFSEGISRS